MLRAKRAIERALDQGDAVIALPMVENVRSLTDELATAGLTVTVRSVLDQELKENFAVRLKELRARLGMSQEDFARDYDLQKKTVQGWELGKKVPDHGNRLLIRMIEKDPAAVRRLVNGA